MRSLNLRTRIAFVRGRASPYTPPFCKFQTGDSDLWPPYWAKLVLFGRLPATGPQAFAAKAQWLPDHRAKHVLLPVGDGARPLHPRQHQRRIRLAMPNFVGRFTPSSKLRNWGIYQANVAEKLAEPKPTPTRADLAPWAFFFSWLWKAITFWLTEMGLR